MLKNITDLFNTFINKNNNNQENKLVNENEYAILPAWFIKRMTTDTWFFGLMMSNGKTIIIESITRVYRAANNSIWIDAIMCDRDIQQFNKKFEEFDAFICPTERTAISINCAHILAAFEVADT